MKPPPQPSLPYSPEQSTICWMEYLVRVSCLSACRASMAVIAEIAQLAAQVPSLATDLSTMPFSVQFRDAGGLGASEIDPLHLTVIALI